MIKSAALFVYPDLIDVCLSPITHPLKFFAELPPDAISVTLPIHMCLEELIPFVELNPLRYFSALMIPPNDHMSFHWFSSMVSSDIRESYFIENAIRLPR
jgi:hypothetical protein